MTDFKDIHFGDSSEAEENMCNLASNYYKVSGIDKQKDHWTVTLKSSVNEIKMAIWMYQTVNNQKVVSMNWAADDEEFGVPDTLSGFKRGTNSPYHIDFDESLVEVTGDESTNLKITVKNTAQDKLFTLNGMVTLPEGNHWYDSHLNFWDVDIYNDGNLIGLGDQTSDSMFLKDGVYSLWQRMGGETADQKLPGKNAAGVEPFVISASATMPSVGFFSNSAAA